MLTYILFGWSTQYYTQVPNWQWAKGAIGSGAESGNAVSIDTQGNSYVTGYFYSTTIVFGSYTLTNKGNYDVFIVKYDVSGNILWAKSAGGIYDDVGLSVAADGSGNIYVTGYFYSPTIIVGTQTLTNSGASDIFITKYDTLGNELWTTVAGGTSDDACNSITINTSGSIFITGIFKSAPLVLGTYTLTNTGSDDAFIAKIDGSGTIIWAKSTNGSASDGANSIATDALGNVFVSGFFTSTTFALDTYTLINTGNSDIFIVKYDTMGNTLWAKSSGGTYNDKSYGLAVDGNGNVFLSGTFFSPTLTLATFTLANTGNFDFFVAKYDTFGNAIWVNGEGGFYDDTALGIAADGAGNVFVTGHFHSPSITLGSYTLSNNGIGDVYIVKYDATGNVVWATSAGGISDDGSSSLALDITGSIVITGYFISPTVVFPSNTLTNTGNEDMFVAKLSNTISTKINDVEVTNEAFLVYPNPSNGFFNITSKELKVEEIEIFNQLGERIYLAACQPTNYLTVNLLNQASGIYYIKIKSGERLASKIITIL